MKIRLYVSIAVVLSALLAAGNALVSIFTRRLADDPRMEWVIALGVIWGISALISTIKEFLFQRNALKRQQKHESMILKKITLLPFPFLESKLFRDEQSKIKDLSTQEKGILFSAEALATASITVAAFCLLSAQALSAISQIAVTLNREGIMTPMRYKHDTGILRKWPCVCEDNFWTDANIGKILRDERYIGTVIYGKRVRKNIGHWDNRAVDKADWIICADQHDAIISKEDFEAVQQVLAQRPGIPYTPHNSGPLQRKVFCGVCGHAMRRCSKPRPHYRCVTHSYTDNYTCTGHGVDEADILDAVLESIRLYAISSMPTSHKE